MASDTCWSRRKSQFAYAIGAPIDDEHDPDESSGDRPVPGDDPQYADLPCYVPLIDDDGLEPFALETPPNGGANERYEEMPVGPAYRKYRSRSPEQPP